ncbi:MAG: hypothetical protein ACK5NT_12870 [Pyrinomonadaceae bacterium]
MKRIPETTALRRLKLIRESFRITIKHEYEHKAKDCLNCNEMGSCCLDAHFVNVHISRIEAVAIIKALDSQDIHFRAHLAERIRSVSTKLKNETGSVEYGKTYTCPLFEKGIGCLVHHDAKPVPCISHGCYENRHDQPPEELLEEKERELSRLNSQTYGLAWNWLPLPVWLERMLS